MRDTSAWSFNCGLWGGVRVQVHASLVVMFVFIVYLAARLRPPCDLPLYSVLCDAILLASVALHELVHAAAARRLGGNTDLVVLGPLGGMHSPNVPRDPQRELIVALAEPAANLVVV